jgi:hypothetical protein
MALIKLQSAEVIPASANNDYVGNMKSAFVCQEYKTLPDGRNFPVRYTVWTNGMLNMPAIGSVVTVMGELSVSVKEGNNGKSYANLSINEPTVEVIGAPKPATVEDTAVAVQDIADGLANSLKLPF